MASDKTLQKMLAILLVVGVTLSILLVVMGSTLFLILHSNENIHTFLAQNYQLDKTAFWHFSISLTPFNIITLGLITLVGTQILRVGLMTCFYIVTRDYWFIVMSAFILIVLIFSSFFRH